MDIFVKLIVNFEKVAREVVEQSGSVIRVADWMRAVEIRADAEFDQRPLHEQGQHARLCRRAEVLKGRHTDQETVDCGIHFPGHHRHAEQVLMPGKRNYILSTPPVAVARPGGRSCTPRTWPTRSTQLYVHVKEEALSQRASAAMASVPKVKGECDDAEDEMIGRLDTTGHREKLGPEGLWCAMITKTLQPNDPLAIKTIMDELTDLQEHNVWDEANPVEANEMALNEGARGAHRPSLRDCGHQALRIQGRPEVQGPHHGVGRQDQDGDWSVGNLSRDRDCPIYDGCVPNSDRGLLPDEEREVAAKRLCSCIRASFHEGDENVFSSPESMVVQA